MDQKKRRSSILKKTTRYEAASPTQTFTKSSRRISFSGTKSVKEFIAGEDKATIWGTSYEEEDGIHAGAAASKNSIENAACNEIRNISMVARRNRLFARNTVSESDKENFMMDITSDSMDLDNTQNFALSYDNRTFTNTFDISLNSFEIKNLKFKREALAILAVESKNVDNSEMSVVDTSPRLERCHKVFSNDGVISDKDRSMLQRTAKMQKNRQADNVNMLQQFEDRIDQLGFEDCPTEAFNNIEEVSIIVNNPQQKRKTLIFADENIDIEDKLNHRQVLNSQQQTPMELKTQLSASSTEDFAMISMVKSSKGRSSLHFPHGEQIDINARGKVDFDPKQMNVAFEHPERNTTHNHRTIIFEGGETVDMAELGGKHTKMKGNENSQEISMDHMNNIVIKSSDKTLSEINESIQLQRTVLGAKRQTCVFDNQDVEVEMETHNKFSIQGSLIQPSCSLSNENEKNKRRQLSLSTKRQTCIFNNDAIDVETAIEKDRNSSMNIRQKDLTLVKPECMEEKSICIERAVTTNGLQLKQNTASAESLNSKFLENMQPNYTEMDISFNENLIVAKENLIQQENALPNCTDRKRKTIVFTNETILDETIIAEKVEKLQDIQFNISVVSENVNLNNVSADAKSQHCTSSRQTMVFPHGEDMVNATRIMQVNVDATKSIKTHDRRTLIFEKRGEIDLDEMIDKKRRKPDKDFLEKYYDKQNSELQEIALHRLPNRTLANEDIEVEVEQAAGVSKIPFKGIQREEFYNNLQQSARKINTLQNYLNTSPSSSSKSTLPNIIASRVYMDMSLDKSLLTSSILEANEKYSTDNSQKPHPPRKTIIFSKETALDITEQIVEADNRIDLVDANVNDILVNPHQSTVSSCRQALVFDHGERIDIDTNNRLEFTKNPKSNAECEDPSRKSTQNRRTIIFEGEHKVDIDEIISSQQAIDIDRNFDETTNNKIDVSTAKIRNETNTDIYSNNKALKKVSSNNKEKFLLNDDTIEDVTEFIKDDEKPSTDVQMCLTPVSFLEKSSIAQKTMDKVNSMWSIPNVSRILNFDSKEPTSNRFTDRPTSIPAPERISKNLQTKIRQHEIVTQKTEKQTNSTPLPGLHNDTRKTNIFTNHPINISPTAEDTGKLTDLKHDPVPVNEYNEAMSICIRECPTKSCRQTLLFHGQGNIGTDLDKVLDIAGNMQASFTDRKTIIFEKGETVDTADSTKVSRNAQSVTASSEVNHAKTSERLGGDATKPSKTNKRRTVVFDNDDMEVEMEIEQCVDNLEKRLLVSHKSQLDRTLNAVEDRSLGVKHHQIEDNRESILNAFQQSAQSPLNAISSQQIGFDNIDLRVLERERLVFPDLDDMPPVLDETYKSIGTRQNAKSGNQTLQRKSAQAPVEETILVNRDKYNAPAESHNASQASSKARFENNSWTTTNIHARLLKKYTPDSIYLSQTARCPMIAGSFHTTGSSSSFSPNTTDALCNLNPSPTAGVRCSFDKNRETDESFYQNFKRDYAELTIDATRSSPFGIDDDDDDNIEKTHIDLIDTISIHSIPDTPEKIEVCEASVAFQIFEANEPTVDLKNITLSEHQRQSLCRKCKNCQRAMLNDTTLAEFNLEEPAGIMQLNFDALNKLKGKPRIQDVLNEFKERRLSSCFNSTYEESILQPSAPSVEFLLRNYDECYRQSLEEENQSENYVGAVFPLIPSFEFLFLNRIKTTKSGWIFNMINLPIGVLECRHRIVKSIRLMVHFNSDDLYTPHCSRLDFSKVLLEKCKLYKNPTVFDRIVLNEIYLRVPNDLTAFCSSSIDLFEFLNNINGICERSHVLTKALLKVIYSHCSSLYYDESENCIVKRTVCMNQTSAKQQRMEFRILIWNIEKMSSTDILLPSRSYFNDSLRSLPAGLEFLEKFLSNPVNFLKQNS